MLQQEGMLDMSWAWTNPYGCYTIWLHSICIGLESDIHRSKRRRIEVCFHCILIGISGLFKPSLLPTKTHCSLSEALLPQYLMVHYLCLVEAYRQ